MLGSAVFCTLDSQGRILLPQGLRKVASLNKKAFLIGFNNKFELWSEENFIAHREADDAMLQELQSKANSHPVLSTLKL